MKTSDAVALLDWLWAQPQFGHYRRDEAAYMAFAETLDDVPVSFVDAKRAAASLLSVDDQRFPSAQAIRRRLFEDTGLLAPSWASASMTLGDVVRRRGYSTELPDLLAQVVRAKGGIDHLLHAENPDVVYAQVRNAYEQVAADHDRFILEPGGVERFKALCDWIDAVSEWDRLRPLGRQAAYTLGDGDPPTTTADARAVIDRYRAMFGCDPSPGFDPVECYCYELGEGEDAPRAGLLPVAAERYAEDRSKRAEYDRTHGTATDVTVRW